MRNGVRTTEVFMDSLSPGLCRGCREWITWAVNARTGKRMPFDGELVALQTKHNPGDRRLIAIVDLDTCHFATCVKADDFRRKQI